MSDLPRFFWIDPSNMVIEDLEIPNSSVTLYDVDLEPHDSRMEYIRRDAVMGLPEVQELFVASARVLNALAAAKIKGNPHTLSPAMALACSALSSAVRSIEEELAND